MPTDTDIRELAYLVRTSQLAFVQVPEVHRKAVAGEMARLSDAQMSQYAESRRFPRGSGHGSVETTRVG